MIKPNPAGKSMQQDGSKQVSWRKKRAGHKQKSAYLVVCLASRGAARSKQKVWHILIFARGSNTSHLMPPGMLCALYGLLCGWLSLGRRRMRLGHFIFQPRSGLHDKEIKLAFPVQIDIKGFARHFLARFGGSSSINRRNLVSKLSLRKQGNLLYLINKSRIWPFWMNAANMEYKFPAASQRASPQKCSGSTIFA